MKFTWSVEPNRALVLRCPKGGPRAHVGLRIDGSAYAATILEPGMPGRGPFRFRAQAAQWCQDYIKREGYSDAEFGPMPPDPEPINDQKHRGIEPTLFEWRT